MNWVPLRLRLYIDDDAHRRRDGSEGLAAVTEIPEAERLLEVVRWSMPFGKYKGVVLIDLPEPYLVWFSQRGFPKGKLGEALALTLEIKINGLEDLVRPLRSGS